MFAVQICSNDECNSRRLRPLELRILQIEAGLNLFPGLLNGIQDLGHINNGYDIKAIVRHDTNCRTTIRKALALDVW